MEAIDIVKFNKSFCYLPGLLSDRAADYLSCAGAKYMNKIGTKVNFQHSNLLIGNVNHSSTYTTIVNHGSNSN